MKPLIDNLALIHVTNHRPQITSEGIILKTAFEGSGGLQQSTDNPKLRPTLHYTLQSAVTDHAYGQFEGKKYVVVAPLKEALEKNTTPESSLASDVAFFPINGKMNLKDGMLIEFNPDMPPSQFIERQGNTITMATEVNSRNFSQAKQWFENLQNQGYGVEHILKRFEDPYKAWSTSEITELGVTTALHALNKPTLEQLKGIKIGTPMGFDGWLSRPEMESLNQEIQNGYLVGDMKDILTTRHDGTAGDRLFTAMKRCNVKECEAIIEDPSTASRIQEFGREYIASDLFQKLRQKQIIHEIEQGPSLIENHLGQERTGLVKTFFNKNSNMTFEHPAMGAITLNEVEAALKQRSSFENKKTLEILIHKSMVTGTPDNAYQHMAKWINEKVFQIKPPAIPSFEVPESASFKPLEQRRKESLPPPPPPLEHQGFKPSPK